MRFCRGNHDGSLTARVTWIAEGIVPEAPESPSTFSSQRSGFLGGGELGYDRRIDQFTLGLQLDLSGGDLRAGAHSAGTDLTGAVLRSFTGTDL